MGKRRILISLLISVVVALFLWILEREIHGGADPSIRDSEVLQLEPTERPGRVEPRAPAITAVPFRDPGGMRYSVRDRGTQKPVAGVTLLGPEGISVGVTASDGALKFKEGEGVQVTGVILPLRSGDEQIALTESDVVVVTATERTLLVDYYARLKLLISGPHLPLKAVRGRIIEQTAVSDKDGWSESEFELLQSAACDIDAYANALRRKPGSRYLDFKFTNSVSADGAMEEQRVRWRGRCAVELELDGWIAATAFVELVPGQAHWLSMEFHQPPTVSGVLLDESGRPITGAPVWVACYAEFGKGDVFPHVATSGPTEGRAVVQDRRTKVTTVHTRVSGLTAEDGTWSVKMGLANEIAAYAFLEGRDRAFVTHSGARFESVSGIVLRAPRSKDVGTMLVVDDGTGVGLADAIVHLTQAQPLDPFRISIPSLRCDAAGRVPIGWLNPNMGYYGAAQSGDTLLIIGRPPDGVLVPKRGGVIRARKPSQ